MKAKAVLSVCSILIFSMGYAVFQYQAVQAETILEEGDEKVKEDTVEIEDSTGELRKDTLLIIKDSLLIERPEIGEVDTIPFVDTLDITQEKEEEQGQKQQATGVTIPNEKVENVPVDSIETSEPVVEKALIKKDINPFSYIDKIYYSAPLIASKDTARIIEYLRRKAYPKEKLSPYFSSSRMYNYSEEIDLKKRTVLVKTTFGGGYVQRPIAMNLDDFVKIRFPQHLYSMLQDDIVEAQRLKVQNQQSQGIIPDIEFPKIKMPKAMRRFFGDNIGRLKVTGSQRITIGGSHTIRKPDPVTESSKKGFFPDLKMEQKLNLGISGTIGKKIKVDVKQTSDESIFEKNKISIKYEGDEDDPIKLIEAGDTRLALSGSQFISYSASSEDLFGIKGEFEFGKLKLTTILSQQEGQQASASATGNAIEQETDFMDKNFARNKYFLFNEPDSLFVGPDGQPVNPDTLPVTQWSYINSKMPKDGSVRIFIDDGRVDPNDVTGYDLQGNEYKFYELTDPINDFFIDYLNAPYMIEFLTGIANNYKIGVIYEERSGKKWGSWQQGQNLIVKMIKLDYNVAPENLPAALWDYQFKNIYSLGAKDIDPQGFEVKVFFEDPNNGFEKTYGVLDTTNNVLHKFIDILGLDTNGDGVVNGNDETVDLEKGLVIFPQWQPFQPYWFSEYSSTLGNPMVYNELNPDPTDDDYNPFYLGVKMNKVGSTINLGHINIIEGSEKVYVDGQLMTKGVDYDIDYFSGTVRLKGAAAEDPNATVKVDFEYEPFFSVDKKSMFGIRADYEFNKNAKIGATFMYEGGSSGNKHVRVGAEPKKIFVGDIDGSVKTELPFVTDLVDMIPLVRTNEKSTVSLSGEVAMNLPNPNATDKGEAYIDDMEAVNEIFSIGISRAEYVYASHPVGVDTMMADTLNPEISRGDLNWYNPHNQFQKRDVYPDLPENEGREYISVLECKLKPSTPLPSWGGIMKSFGSTAEDFSKKRFIELTIKSDAVDGDSLFIDLGTMTEDYYPILKPNNILNYEDLNQDGVLDVGEDVGLDNVQGTDPVPPKSHEFDDTPGVDDGNDDYNYTAGSNIYDGINGDEVNGKLDTEDLNKNFVLDTRNNYFEYAINLADVDPDIIISEYNGWKFIRIPLQDSTYFQPVGEGTITWDFVQGARLWMKTESSNDLTLDIVTFEVLGNKWKASAILDTTLHKPADLQPNEMFEVATESNQNNLDYTPPPGALINDDDKEKEIEQSLVLKVQNLQSNRYIYARENFSEKLNLLNYSKVKLWVYAQHAEDSPPSASSTETIVFRLGADTSNYYEYRKEVQVYDDIDAKMSQSRWKDITIDFTEFTRLKEPNMPDTTSNVRIIGNPTLSQIRQVAVGLIRPDSMQTTFSGRIFFDDIRVSDPYDEVGFAARVTLDTKIADFADLRVNYERKTPNFYSIGSASGSGNDRYSIDIRNNVYLHKFTPDDWGFNIPLKFDYSFSESKPRFRPNSDVKLITPEEKDEYKTLSESKTASISLRKNKKSTNFFAKALLDNTFIKASVQNSTTLSPTKKDTTYKYTGTFNYELNFSKQNEKNYAKIFKGFNFYFLPQRISLETDYVYSKFNSWTKQAQSEVFINDNKKPVNTLNPRFNLKYEILSNVESEYSLNMMRDLDKKNIKSKFNIGVETNRTQNVGLKYNPTYLKAIKFTSQYKCNYVQNRRERQNNDTLIVDYEVNNDRRISGGVTLNFSKWGKSFMNLIDLPEYVEIEDSVQSVIEDTTGKNLEEPIPENGDTLDVVTGEEIKVEEEKKRPRFGIVHIGHYATKVIGFAIHMVGSTDLSYSSNYKTKYYVQPDSLPNFSYQIGFHDPEHGILQSRTQTDDFMINSRSRFSILKSLSAEISTKYDINLNNASGNKTKTETITLPGLTLAYDGLDTLLKLKFLKNTTLSSNFTRMITNTGPGFWTKPGSNTQAFQLSPLLSLSTRIMDKINTNFSCNYSLSNQINYDMNNQEIKNDELSFNSTFRYSFQSAKGIKIPLLGRLNMTNKTDMDLDISYRSTRSQTLNSTTGKWDFTSNQNTLSVKPRIAYNFSRDINAGMTAEYSSEKNVKAGTSSTTVALNIWVEFKF